MVVACGVVCERDLVTSFQRLEASSDFGVACALVVASLLYPLVACVLVVALLPLEEVCHQWKKTPITGVEGDDHVVVASLPYLGFLACVMGVVSLPCHVGLVASVLVVAFLPLEEVCHQWK